MASSPAGQIRHIAFSPERGLPRPLHPAASLAAGHGIVGDRRAGKSPERALNLLDERHLEALAAAGYAVGPGSLGENVVVAGLDLDALPAGTRLALGPVAVVRIVKARTGCQNLGYIHGDFPAAAAGRVGQMCAVEAGGEIRLGDAVRVLDGAA
jgi:MOSC domain-containing protein YiiM